MINTYEFDIVCPCPMDPSLVDVYHCIVEKEEMLEVKAMLEKIASLTNQPRFQEQLTQDIATALGAHVTTTGIHSAVRTRCECEG